MIPTTLIRPAISSPAESQFGARPGRRLLLLVLFALGPFATAMGDDSPPTMRGMIESYATDAGALRSFYNVEMSSLRSERLERFLHGWSNDLERVDFGALDAEGRVDYLLLRSEIDHARRSLEHRLAQLDDIRPWLPFAATIIELEESRWRVQPPPPRETAERVNEMARVIRDLTASFRSDEQKDDRADETGSTPAPARPALTPTTARRTAQEVRRLQITFGGWFQESDSYQPEFSWWLKAPYKEARQALDDYAKTLLEKVAGIRGEEHDPLIGDPIGRAALLDELVHELIPYSPEQLIEIANRHFAWCEARMLEASRELGFGDDWRRALEHVKNQHVPPGEQVELVHGQARDVISFLDERDLVTIPALCRETWRFSMISEQGQRTLPFAAYGGQRMLVAYPTQGMSHESKLMSMRGNNIHFSRIVTPHELIPGHHLQGFMAARQRTHRSLFRTPFLVEGWALYWELMLWDLDYPRGPEDRIGMLFWRMHRCARIIVSLGFHLGQLSPAEMIDFLVERVGHERDGATSEVRRYIGDDYGPLYQAAYLIGGLQLRALRRELVEEAGWSDRELNDAVLRQNAIPVELIRATLRGQPLDRDHQARWRFAGEVPGSDLRRF